MGILFWKRVSFFFSRGPSANFCGHNSQHARKGAGKNLCLLISVSNQNNLSLNYEILQTIINYVFRKLDLILEGNLIMTSLETILVIVCHRCSSLTKNCCDCACEENETLLALNATLIFRSNLTNSMHK